MNQEVTNTKLGKNLAQTLNTNIETKEIQNGIQITNLLRNETYTVLVNLNENALTEILTVKNDPNLGIQILGLTKLDTLNPEECETLINETYELIVNEINEQNV